jgi:hypothetical protein
MATVKLGDKGPEVKKLQHEVNKTLTRAKLSWLRGDADGVAGHHTFKAARYAAAWQGLSTEQLRTIGNDFEVTNHIYDVLTAAVKRSDEMKKRAQGRRANFAKLRDRHNNPPPASGVTTFDGKEVAAWIADWLEKSREAGWKGTVTSGYRDPAYSESLCLAMCGAPSCPGRCAGRTSNHSGVDYPAGAVDVTDYTTFAQIQKQIGSPLQNQLGAADPVNYSYTGH